jgi:hypothetical protein
MTAIKQRIPNQISKSTYIKISLNTILMLISYELMIGFQELQQDHLSDNQDPAFWEYEKEIWMGSGI